MKQRLTAKVRIVHTLGKLLLAVLVLGLIAIAAPGFLFYKVSRPAMAGETLDPSYYLLKYSTIRVHADNGRETDGWWIAGKRGAPGIVLYPGFGMTRSDVLSLASALSSAEFNILIFAQRGSGASPPQSSTFGLKESRDLISAIHSVQKRPESDPARIGIWGVDVGAYSALVAAGSIPEVRAIAADSVFESAYEFLDIRLGEAYGVRNRWLQFGCGQMLKLLSAATGSAGGNEIPFESLSDRSLLLIQGGNRRELGRLTGDLYAKLRSKKEMISFDTSRVHMMKGEEFQDYDRRVTDFFLRNL
ncbi:MAG: hypothetical protein JW793_02485 [Acidobacteria bacterium]|nr:hypothetical protein [Acidobacteriota bacterium]